MLIFQSTLPRRERPLLLILLKDGEHFNPRSHEGSDQEPHNIYFQPCISIHAPTKGATVPIAYHFLFIYVFQSTLPRRERPISAIFEMSFDSFQSTLPREERPFVSQIFKSSAYFNPRSRERSDIPRFLPLRIYPRISIHAPARGATYSHLVILL